MTVLDARISSLMQRVAQEVWDHVAHDYRHLTLGHVAQMQEEIASEVLRCAEMGVRDPVIMRGMGLAAVRSFEKV